MFKNNRVIAASLIMASAIASCKVPEIVQRTENRTVPTSYAGNEDSTNMTSIQWRSFFTDKNLVDLVDTALKNNQELMITMQEVEMARNEIRMRQGSLLPTVGARLGVGVEKVGRYTSQGAGDKSTEIEPGKEVPDALTDITVEGYARWEVDIWKKLRNAKKAAITRYLASVEGRNFGITN